MRAELVESGDGAEGAQPLPTTEGSTVHETHTTRSANGWTVTTHTRTETHTTRTVSGSSSVKVTRQEKRG
jgi:hypothetical protein